MFPGITFKWRVHERWSRECFLFLIIRKYKFHAILFPYNSRTNAYRPKKDVEGVLACVQILRDFKPRRGHLFL